MRMDKYGRELDLILLLSENVSYTAQQLADRLGITRRNLYYYFEYLRECGFVLVKHGTSYRLDRSSPFFRRLHENVGLNRDEALFLLALLDTTERHDTVAESVRSKLRRQHNLDSVDATRVRKRLAHNAERLKEAMAAKCMAVLKSYSSPHSQSVADRIVEPFALMNDAMDVRCYEVSSHMNKTFRLARMADVELIDVPWIHEDDHREAYTDIFMFSGEERHHIILRMGQLSRNLMAEEHPASEPFIRPDGEGKWILETDVVNLLGPSRFVSGVFEDVEVIGGESFMQHIKERAERMKAHFSDDEKAATEA